MTSNSAMLDKVTEEVKSGKLLASAAENLKIWLTEPCYSQYVPAIVEHLEQEKFEQLNDVFWQAVPFGTGGRRGKMYPIGPGAINERTIGESVQGLADYVKETKLAADPNATLVAGIAYDTRHRSREFAELAAGIMVAAGYTVFFFDGIRSTPELSFLVREKKCDCGVMVTASHNPPSDNAVKVYSETGGQFCPPHDEGVIAKMKATTDIRSSSFDETLAAGKVIYCQDEIDASFIDAVAKQGRGTPTNLRLVYSPLHGVGGTVVPAVLEKIGVPKENFFPFKPHWQPDPDFTNVPGHVSNPERPEVFDLIFPYADEVDADLILATDPDADRLGVGSRANSQPNAPWVLLTGNHVGVLLTDYLLAVMQEEGTLKDASYIVSTIVTTELAGKVAEKYGAIYSNNHHVGFKWIGEAIDELGPENFVLGMEESYGYLVGTHARDKDAAVASVVLTCCASYWKLRGKTLAQRLEEIHDEFGYYEDNQFSVYLEGASGMEKMATLMSNFQKNPPTEIAGCKVAKVRDYTTAEEFTPGGTRTSFDAPRGDLVIFLLDSPGCRVAVRPSGTEPKIKFYLFVRSEDEKSAKELYAKLEAELRKVAADA